MAAEGKADRHHHGKALGHCRDRKANCNLHKDQDLVLPWFVWILITLQKRNDHDHHQYHHSNGPNDPSKPVQGHLERRQFVSLLLRVLQLVGYFTHLGLHASAGDDGLASAVVDGSRHEAHVLREGLIQILHDKHLANLFAFSCQQCLICHYFHALKESTVRRHSITRRQFDDIARHQLGSVHLDDVAIPAHLALGRSHGGKLSDRITRTHFLLCSQTSVEGDNEKDHTSLGKLLESEGSHASEKQQHHDRGQELHEKHLADVVPLFLLQHVPPELALLLCNHG
mmetsp:Transcript_16454/g.44584  ORF Transcript_16454/g.44584 Transcript_16454/m.44584 type:complete len:284 (+) Transcript_16454:2808-3659(+)